MEQRTSPNENPSGQLRLISQKLIDSLRVVLSMVGAGPLSSLQTPPSTQDITRCATMHLLEALKHLDKDNIDQARTSCKGAANLLTLFDEAVR